MKTTTTRALFTAAALIATGSAMGGSNVSPNRKFAWGENIGWINWRDADSTNQGVRLYSRFLSGFAWGENIGWINMGNGAPAGGSYANTNNTNFGVNIDPSTGVCSGFAWGENIGWINFNTTPAVGAQGARYDLAAGRFRGFAWGENIGWINLDDTGTYVCALYSDLNADGSVNTSDLVLLLVNFGQNVTPGFGADFDASGIINTTDLTQLLVQFGRVCQ